MDYPRHQNTTSTSINTPTGTDSQYKYEHQTSYESGIQVQSPLPLSYIKDEKDGVNDHISDLPTHQNRRSSQTSQSSYVVVGGRPTPVRRYSEEWWKRSWDTAIQHRVWPRVIYAFVFLLVLGAWLGGMMGFAVDEQGWGKGQQRELQTRTRRQRESGSQSQYYGQVGLKGALKHFDPVARSLAVEWSGYFEDANNGEITPLANNASTRTPIYIFRDVSTALYNFGNSSAPNYPLNATTSNITFSTGDSTSESWFDVYYVNDDLGFSTQYVLQTDNTTSPHIGVIGAHLWDSVDTEISFGPKDENPTAFRQPLFGYPFDEWSGSIVFVATDPWYQSEFNVSGLGVYPLYSAILTENTLNWRFKIDYNPLCALGDLNGNMTMPDTWLPRDNSLALGPVIGSEGIFPCQLEVTLTASRPPLVKFAAVMAVIVNWTSTFFIFVLTCETLIMRRGYMLSGTDLLGITFTALFALPSVRLLLPGAPDFGILIDLVGIIPNVIIISLCITAIAITKLNRHQKTGEKEHDD